jgi:hypothetical protein
MKTHHIPDGNTVSDLQRHGWVAFGYDLPTGAWVGFDKDSARYEVLSGKFDEIDYAVGYCEGFQYRFAKPAALKRAGIQRVPRLPAHQARA